MVKLDLGIPVKYKNNIDIIVRAIMNTQYKEVISTIYLFRSYAREETNKSSDIDICILLNDIDELNIGKKLEMDKSIEDEIEKLTDDVIAYDIVIGTDDELEKSKDNLFTVLSSVYKHGVKLYGR